MSGDDSEGSRFRTVMITRFPIKEATRLPKLALATALLVTASHGVPIAMIALALTTLFGWSIDNPYMKEIVPGLNPMNPVAAVGFVSLGISLILLRNSTGYRKFILGLAVMVMFVSACRLFATAMGWDKSLDTLLFSDRLDHELRPNRMATATAWSLFALAFSILCLAVSKPKPILAQWLSLVPSATGLTIVNCYIFAVVGGQTPDKPVPMAFHCAVLFALSIIPIFTLTPNHGLAFAIMRESQSSLFARRLMVKLLILPPILALIVNFGSQVGLYDPEYKAAILVTGMTSIFEIIVWVRVRASNGNEEKIHLAKVEAERANAAKSEFLSRMSHELRTPLNAVIGYGQLLEMQSDNPKTLDAAKSILRSGRHLLGLINEVLDLASIEAGKLSLSIEPILLENSLSQAMDLVRPAADAKKVTIRLAAETWEGQYVFADRQRLIQVFTNLLTNAVKYNREGGSIEVEGVGESETSLQLYISDTGHGMTEEGIKRLFVPFERVGDQEVEGTGLGLALSGNFARLMGGDVSLVHSNCEGSTFALVLKKAAPPSVQIIDFQERFNLRTDQQGSVLRAIYIEDNIANVDLLTKVCEEVGGINLSVANSGEAGIKKVLTNLPDLVFLDLHLPDMEGVEVLKRLRSEALTANIPVIVLSADATENQINRLMSAGARAYLTKPLNLRAVFAEVETVRQSLRRTA